MRINQWIVQHDWKGTDGQYGPEFYESRADNTPVFEEGGYIFVKLDTDHKDKVFSVAVQSTGTAGELTVTSAYFATEEEYEVAKAAQDAMPKNMTIKEDNSVHVLKNNWDWQSGKWFGGLDISDYNSLVIEVESSTGSVQFGAQTDAGNKATAIKKTDKPQVYVLDISDAKSLTQIFYQSNPNNEDSVQVTTTKIYLTDKTAEEIEKEIEEAEAAKYADPLEITFNDNGGIFAAKQFDSMSMEAKVEFVFSTENSTNYNGWGPTAISNNVDQSAATKKTMGCNLNGIDGTLSFTFYLSDIAEIINDYFDPSTGVYGGFWNMWGFEDSEKGTCVNTKISIKAYDCTAPTVSDTFTAKEDEEVSAISNVAVDSAKAQKALKNGQIVITRGAKAYNAVGQEL